MQPITHIYSKGGAGETGISVCSNTTYPYSECSLLKKDDSSINPGNALMGSRRRLGPRSSCRFPSNHWRSFILLVAGGNHRAAGRRDYPRYAGSERVVDVWLHVAFL